MNLKDTYNKIAEDWVKDHNSDGWWNEGTNKFLELLSKNGMVLDVGCGAGIKSKYINDKGYKIVGIDFSEKMIEGAKSRLPGSSFFVKDITKDLDLHDSFDGVYAQAVLLHIPKHEISNVIKNITQPLKIGGYFYVAVKEKREDGPEEEVAKENDYGYEYERFFSYFTLDEMKDNFVKNGFEIIYEKVSKSPAGTNWIQLIGKKNG